MFNSLNFAYAALNDAYGVTANSTVVVESKPTRRAFKWRFRLRPSRIGVWLGRRLAVPESSKAI